MADSSFSRVLPSTISSSELSVVSCDGALDAIRKCTLDPPDILAWPDVLTSTSSFDVVRPEVISDVEEFAAPMVKKRKILEATNKRLQMKYEPPVEIAKEMTKEDLAAWRREERRKRNRESAAASRQRQRERIVELEKEVEEYKVKYQCIMKEIASLEDERETFDSPFIVPDAVISRASHLRESSVTTPIPMSIPSSDLFSAVAAPVSPTQVVGSLLEFCQESEKDELLLPRKMISRPAATRIYHPWTKFLRVSPLLTCMMHLSSVLSTLATC
ncbi:hypothetical protein MPSEU_000653300 [Mayamaea pseudoterrestris]|nr:hypothetical protein MPSEU_000653300 [Mayamaea pseudoterrestris]